MAIQKPYDISIKGSTVDAKEDINITWKVSGDLQSSFQVQILNNSSGTLIYSSSVISSYSNRYILPKDKLANGAEYKINITVWSLDGSTAKSNNEIFQTSSRPKVTISMPSEIYNQSYNFQAQYTQNESVKVRSWNAFLYDENRVNVASSGIKTSQTIEYLFSNMNTEKTYYIEFTATSEKGLVGTTGLIPFYVIYSKPNVFVKLNAENGENAGIELSWNVIQIIGYGENYSFVEGEKVDVRNGFVQFEEGFTVESDFTLKIWFKNPTKNIDLVKLFGLTGSINLQLFNDNSFRLFKEVNGYKSCYGANPINTTGNMVVVIQQIGDDLNIMAKEVL